MQIKFLGTSAAEGIPAMFCECDTCKKARNSGGKNIRTRSQAIIDNTILIDFPADTFMHCLYGDLYLPKIHTCIVTHSHSDHFYPADFTMRRTGFAYFSDKTPLTFYLPEPAAIEALPYFEKSNLIKDNKALIKTVTPFEAFIAEEYEITPLKANHAKDLKPVIYIIKKDSKSILYANDTGVFPDETWDYLAKSKPYFDLISLDCTEFATPNFVNGHMSFDTNIKMRDRLKQMGLIDDKTNCIINHFSHNGKLNYDEMVPLAKTEGFIVAYDNLTVEF